MSNRSRGSKRTLSEAGLDKTESKKEEDGDVDMTSNNKNNDNNEKNDNNNSENSNEDTNENAEEKDEMDENDEDNDEDNESIGMLVHKNRRNRMKKNSKYRGMFTGHEADKVKCHFFCFRLLSFAFVCLFSLSFCFVLLSCNLLL